MPIPAFPAWQALRQALAMVMCLALGLCGMPAPAAAPNAPPPAVQASAAGPAEEAPPGTLLLNHRAIVTFRATLQGHTPADRLAAAQAALQAALARVGPGEVTLSHHGGSLVLRLDGQLVLGLAPGDADPGRADTLAEQALAVQQRLQQAVQESREAADLRRIGRGLGLSLAATAVLALLLRALAWARHRLSAATRLRALRWHAENAGAKLVATYASALGTLAQGLVTAGVWLLAALAIELWFTYVLGQFAYTRPWAERSSNWLLGMLSQFALAIAGAVPGLVTAALIFAIARLLVRANTALMARVERGDLVMGSLDADTAGPTRRVGNFVIWLFALALAYPFLPGASSQAFQGVSVLAGLMLSMGASGVVGQVVSGLSVMYARTLRPGEYVRIGDTEGTVTAVGMFATRLQTGLGEEVSLPNGLVFSQPVRNFSRLGIGGQFVLQGAVTIGYATPWRQVHAMLLEAARRTPEVAAAPAPFVVQTALSDFYVEYRLCLQVNGAALPRRAQVMNQLHGHIQDVFNENGVQIMSPHYRGDPPVPQVVAPVDWAPPLVKPEKQPAPPARRPPA